MALSFHHILVPYDGTKIGEVTFNGAIEIAKKFTSKITILSCIEKELTFGFFETQSDKKGIKKSNTEMKSKIDKLIKKAIAHNIRCSSKIVNCSLASKCVASFVKSHKVDLVVMRKSSKINPKKIYHDSTVNYVYAHTNCPMLNL